MGQVSHEKIVVTTNSKRTRKSRNRLGSRIVNGSHNTIRDPVIEEPEVVLVVQDQDGEELDDLNNLNQQNMESFWESDSEEDFEVVEMLN